MDLKNINHGNMPNKKTPSGSTGPAEMNSGLFGKEIR
jgi:hypothetical protein